VSVLTPGQAESQPLDLYLNISQDITLKVIGKNEVHLSGYFEVNEDQMDNYGQEMDEEGEEEITEEELAKLRAEIDQRRDSKNKGE